MVTIRLHTCRALQFFPFRIARFLLMGTWLLAATPTPLKSAEPPWSVSVTIQRIDDPKQIEGRWALSAGWSGFMGTALELRDGKFRYWFMSDVGSLARRANIRSPASTPIAHGSLELVTKGDVQDTRWFLVTHRGRTGLFPASAFETITMRRESPEERIIFKLKDEETKGEWPRYNVPK